MQSSLPVAERPRRPEWMKVRAPSADGRYYDVQKLLHGASLVTVCEPPGIRYSSFVMSTTFAPSGAKTAASTSQTPTTTQLERRLGKLAARRLTA